MDQREKLIMTQNDFQKLSSLVGSVHSDVTELLEEELNRASIVTEEALPKDVVSMNSKVCFEDLDSGAENTVTLVYPHEAKIEESKISILAPVGSALIGLRVGQVIHWPIPHGKKKRLKVKSVLFQPAAGG